MDEIADLAAAEGLVLFVGAGINGKAGCLWPDLVAYVLRRALKGAAATASDAALQGVMQRIMQQDLYTQASVAAVLLGPQRFVPTLRSAVYAKLIHSDKIARLDRVCERAAVSPDWRGDLTTEDAGDFGYLVSIARLCLCRTVKAVVTYNYDTLLEYAIERIGSALEPTRRRATVIIARQIENRGGHNGDDDALKIYHVHGCLPPPGSLMRLGNYPVILAQQDYARAMLAPYEWENSTPLHFLRSFPCVFLGLSMTDWNMLRLLQAVHPGPRRIREQPRLLCVGVAANRIQADIKKRLLADYGVSFHAFISDRFDELPCFTDELNRDLEEEREKAP